MTKDEPMQALPHDPADALDRLLALRPDDLDGWEGAAAADLDPATRAATEALDAEFADVLALWGDAPEPTIALTAADVLALDRAVASPGPRRPVWLPVALAASLALMGVAGVLSQRPAQPDGIKGLVSAAAETRIELQVSIEHRGVETVLSAAQDGAEYGPDDWMAMRFDLRGEPSWVYLFESDGAGASLLVPSAGAELHLEPGVHPLRGGDGAELVYQPEESGHHRYLVVATDAPIDADAIIQGVMEAGRSRPDLWPRHVLAVDSFEATWRE